MMRSRESLANPGEPKDNLPMRPGVKPLLALLRGHPLDLAHVRLQWEQALALADEEHILPWAARLYGRQPSLPQDLRDRLKTAERNAAVAAFFWTSELKNILRAFERKGILAVPLKGPFLAERLYGDTALRVSYDLDLLVAKDDLAHAESALRALGFVPGTPDDYHCRWRRGGSAVELHHDVENPLAFDFHVASALARAQPASFQGQRCLQLAANDELLFLCLHGVRHRFQRLSHILDLCLAFEKLPVSAAARPQMAEAATLLTLGLAMARRLQPEIEAPFIPSTSPAQHSHLQRLANRLWNRALTLHGEPMDWSALHSFYLEIELPRHRLRQRWRHLRILLKRVIQADYEFAARLGFHRSWQARLLRPARLLWDAIANSARRDNPIAR